MEGVWNLMADASFEYESQLRVRRGLSRGEEESRCKDSDDCSQTMYAFHTSLQLVLQTRPI